MNEGNGHMFLDDEMFHATEEYREGMALLEVNVERGIIFLDSVEPEWYKKVDTKYLNMEDGSKCICGWVFSGMMENVDGYNYFDSKYGNVRDDDTAVMYGFYADYDLSVHHSYQWSMLAELWTEKIEKRIANEGLLA